MNAKQYSAYRYGAILKDPAARVTIYFETALPRHDTMKRPLEFNGQLRTEVTTSLDPVYCAAVITVQSSRPLTDAIEKVWLVPESRNSPAARK